MTPAARLSAAIEVLSAIDTQRVPAATTVTLQIQEHDLQAALPVIKSVTPMECDLVPAT